MMEKHKNEVTESDQIKRQKMLDTLRHQLDYNIGRTYARFMLNMISKQGVPQNINRKSDKVRVTKNRYQKFLMDELRELTRSSIFRIFQKPPSKIVIHRHMEMKYKEIRNTDYRLKKQPAVTRERLRYLWYLARQYDKKIRLEKN